MSHAHYIEDGQGQLVDIANLCSDSCNREYAGEAYGGWNGCVELEYTDWCANCGVVLPGFDDEPCIHQRSVIVVNRTSRDDERCPCGNYLAVASA